VATSESICILTIETATRTGSVCLARGERILSARKGEINTKHSANLLAQVQSVLEEAAVTMREIDLFAAAIGPGSFTGLRIGLATVKAFAATLGRACVGIETLHAIAHAAGNSPRTMALLPAGRGEVYWQMLKISEKEYARELSEAGHRTPAELINWAGKFRALKWAGEEAREHAEAIRERAERAGIEFIDEAAEEANRARSFEEANVWRLARPFEMLAEHVSALALERYRNGKLSRPEELQAYYVRLSDAEIKQQCRAQNPFE
jgi:tRNA threonylcarbamoyladenosine biosynthesis protein TsaB